MNRRHDKVGNRREVQSDKAAESGRGPQNYIRVSRNGEENVRNLAIVAAKLQDSTKKSRRNSADQEGDVFRVNPEEQEQQHTDDVVPARGLSENTVQQINALWNELLMESENDKGNGSGLNTEGFSDSLRQSLESLLVLAVAEQKNYGEVKIEEDAKYLLD